MLGECSPQQGAAPLQATQIQIEEMLPKLNYRYASQIDTLATQIG